MYKFQCLLICTVLIVIVLNIATPVTAGKRKISRTVKNVAIGAAAGGATYYGAKQLGKGIKHLGGGYGRYDYDDDDYYRYRRGYRRSESAMSKCSNGRIYLNMTYNTDFYCPRWGEPENWVGCCHDDAGYGYCCPWYQSGAFIGLVVAVVIIVALIVLACCCCFCYFRKKGTSVLSKFTGGGGGRSQGGGGVYTAPGPSPQPAYPMSSYPPAPAPQPYPQPAAYPTAPGGQYPPYPTAGAAPPYPTAGGAPPYPTAGGAQPYPTATPSYGYPVAH